MPHLTLEYTGNLEQEIILDDLFPRLHGALVDVAAIPIGNCKSRAYRLDNYYIADGGPQHAFVHLAIRFMEGRSVEVKRMIGRGCLEVLEELCHSPAGLALQITVEIQDIERTTYFKLPEGTL
jgi:5-carboxymethyl-2-hydroxymuconate isomerase